MHGYQPGLVAKFKVDEHPQKVNLAQGAYRTDEGQPLVLDVVRKAEKLIANDASLNKEYLGVEGHPEFLKLTREFVFGSESAAVQEGRVATVQSLSGTGSLRVAAPQSNMVKSVKQEAKLNEQM